MISFQVTGVREAVARLQGLQGDELAKKSDAFLAKAVRSVVVPAVKRQTPRSPHGLSGRYPHSPGTLRTKVTARKVRPRPGEMTVYSVRARKFYAPMVIEGTKPHLITPAGGGPTAARLVRRANRGGAALLVNGLFVSAVHHPGARADPFIDRAAHSINPDALAIQLGKELVK